MALQNSAISFNINTYIHVTPQHEGMVTKEGLNGKYREQQAWFKIQTFCVIV